MGGDSSSSDSGQSDEQIEAQERFDDQQTGNFGGGNTNVSNPGDSGGFAGDTLFDPSARGLERGGRAVAFRYFDINRSVWLFDEEGDSSPPPGVSLI